MSDEKALVGVPLRFSCMTFNVWGRFMWPYREPALRAFFKQFQPDVLLVQEASPDILRVMSEELPWHHQIKDDFGGWASEGNILWDSRLFRLVEHGAEDIKIEQHPLRRLFWARLQVLAAPHRTILASTAHLTYQQHEDELLTGQSPRIAQCIATAEALGKMETAGDVVLFGGDLNDAVHPPLVLSKSGFKDVFDALGLMHSYTHPWGTSLEDESQQCLDWIFSKGPVSPISAHVVYWIHKAFTPGDWPTASDHYPVQAIFHMPL